MNPSCILVVDDEAHMRRVLEIMLGRLGHKVFHAADGRHALAVLEEEPIDLVLTDLRMPVLDGIGLLREMRERQWNQPVIVMTAQGSVDAAVQAMKLGAQDFLARPFDVDVLELAVARVLEQRHLRLAHDFLRAQVDPPSADLFGHSAVMREVQEQIRQVGPTRAAVFITGETGTGKELAARALHRSSERAGELFVPINCAALPNEMVEAELFGHEKGAFTGAVKERVGKFELAHRGTIFLDEITEMPLHLQSKLLRVLQEGVVERLGGNRPIQLDVRVIAASNRDPREAVRLGVLREDLYYRLNVFSLRLPPLRARREDIEGLVAHFGRRLGQRIDITPDALAMLGRYDWPGNVRELDNVIQRALVLSRGRRIEAHHLPYDILEGQVGAGEEDAPATLAETATAVPAPQPQRSQPALEQLAAQSLDLPATIGALEALFIDEALRRTEDNKRQAAQLLGISERTLWYKLGRMRTPP